jgi:hypothetical protein
MYDPHYHYSDDFDDDQGEANMKRKPEVGEYWWAWPPTGGDAEPVEILSVMETGNYALGIIGRSDFGYARQWSLDCPISDKPT